ncbi:SRPBCC family protein [Silvimonas iriomotensis]|uniref:Polyketide cyclase / dehydrase and lipid transport n=1 Tax=Silvimonas iriomotensis TaxID=449662 RepID=A0ABQ2P3L4_9NEIS|nr:SRPBCC family protein [Silvimonas iriomotensis]GGP17595.1 hypothetical protein GCM10010970_00520 [Silvimonas iriomotensis]
MWSHEESITTTATPARIWQLFADVPGWKNWNAGIDYIEIHGPFAAGTTFAMQPPGQDGFVSTLTQVTALSGFTDETVIDGTTVVVDHRITPLSDTLTRITYSTTISGPQADEFGPMVTGDFADVLAALKALAERG